MGFILVQPLYEHLTNCLSAFIFYSLYVYFITFKKKMCFFTAVLQPFVHDTDDQFSMDSD